MTPYHLPLLSPTRPLKPTHEPPALTGRHGEDVAADAAQEVERRLGDAGEGTLLERRQPVGHDAAALVQVSEAQTHFEACGLPEIGGWGVMHQRFYG